MSKNESFVDLCAKGHALLEDIDAFVSDWHDHPHDMPLHEFLGMTWPEYSLWISEPDILAHIVTAHRDKRPFTAVIEDIKNLPMAARSPNPIQASKLTKWLEQQGKLV
ncbi:MAG TPA: hypothetical protein VGB82_25810 [Alphaproteobacteria bacterium]